MNNRLLAIEDFNYARGICKRFRAIRINLFGEHKSQIIFAYLLKIAPSTLNEIETFKNRPTLRTIEKLKATTSVDLNWLITGEPKDYDLNKLPRIEIPVELLSDNFGTVSYKKFQELVANRY